MNWITPRPLPDGQDALQQRHAYEVAMFAEALRVQAEQAQQGETALAAQEEMLMEIRLLNLRLEDLVKATRALTAAITEGSTPVDGGEE